MGGKPSGHADKPCCGAATLSLLVALSGQTTTICWSLLGDLCKLACQLGAHSREGLDKLCHLELYCIARWKRQGRGLPRSDKCIIKDKELHFPDETHRVGLGVANKALTSPYQETQAWRSRRLDNCSMAAKSPSTRAMCIP